MIDLDEANRAIKVLQRDVSEWRAKFWVACFALVCVSAILIASRLF